MNSKTTKPYSTFNAISEELNMYGKELRSALLTRFLNERLSDSIKNYNYELDKSVKFLEGRNAIAVLKAITMKKKRDDRAIIDSYMEE